MKTKVKIGIAVIVILGAMYWGFTALRQYTYSGSNIMFPIGAGHVVISNLGDEAMPIELRSGERSSIFRVASTELGLQATAARQGTGRDSYYALFFDLPPGQARIDVTRGNDIQMIARGDTRVEALVSPTAPNTVRWTLILSGALIAGSLYYISKWTNHRWLTALRNKLTRQPQQVEQTTA